MKSNFQNAINGDAPHHIWIRSFLDMILGHFEPGGLIFAFIMIMFGRHYRKKNRYVREMYFYLLAV